MKYLSAILLLVVMLVYYQGISLEVSRKNRGAIELCRSAEFGRVCVVELVRTNRFEALRGFVNYLRERDK
jgi:hypothetical protein